MEDSTRPNAKPDNSLDKKSAVIFAELHSNPASR